MCGIFIHREPDNFHMLSHRGLEDSMIERKGLSLCHTRLPIQTEVGDDYQQPIEIEKNVYMLYNGELFNYNKELYVNDVDYLIHFFHNYNPDSLDINRMQNWDGFWAIVIIDFNRNHMLAFTDPLGKKQLYYDDEYNICSEINPLCNKDSSYDKVFKSTVLKFGYNMDDRTPYTNIKRVLPGKFYSFDLKKYTLNTIDYWDWNYPIQSTGGFRYLMNRSVQNRTLSKNYPISLLLSGGLDSTIVLYHLIFNGYKNENINIYAINNEEDEYYIELCKDFFGVDITYINYSMDSLTKEELRDLFRSYNETPIDLGSVIPQHKLFSCMSEKIVLSGDGADELFGGYKRINKYDSQHSDVFQELPFYHLPRLDRASMRYTMELRCPFLSHDIIKFALKLKYPFRKNKVFLKDLYSSSIPKEIIERKKETLKNTEIRTDKMSYRMKIAKIFYGDDYENF